MLCVKCYVFVNNMLLNITLCLMPTNQSVYSFLLKGVQDAVESLYVTVLGSAAYIGALVPCQGVAWVQKRSDATQKTSVKTGVVR